MGEYLFVEMDSYAIALCFLSPLGSGGCGVTRWGLFLRRGCYGLLFQYPVHCWSYGRHFPQTLLWVKMLNIMAVSELLGHTNRVFVPFGGERDRYDEHNI